MDAYRGTHCMFQVTPNNQTIGVLACPASTPKFAATTTLCRSEKGKESEISCGFRSSCFRPGILASEPARRSPRLPEIPARDATELNWMPIARNKPGRHLPRLFRE